jgi:hypothetical protein
VGKLGAEAIELGGHRGGAATATGGAAGNSDTGGNERGRVGTEVRGRRDDGGKVGAVIDNLADKGTNDGVGLTERSASLNQPFGEIGR